MTLSSRYFIHALSAAIMIGTTAVQADSIAPTRDQNIVLALNTQTYRDGTYQGLETSAYYGPMQVQARIQGGRLVAVDVLKYPNDRNTSRRINAAALPLLQTSVIQAQSTKVNIVTGATLTSRAYLRTLNADKANMMRETRLLMGMPITVEIVDKSACQNVLERIFDHFAQIEQRFSPFKSDSEVSRLNQGRIALSDISAQFREVLAIAARTKLQTHGYFDIGKPDGTINPSGIVKGWAIRNAANLLLEDGFENFFVDAGGDIQSHGCNADGTDWLVGIQNPFNAQEIIKAIKPCGRGVATSGTYVRGQHIYDPLHPEKSLDEIVSCTIIGCDVLEADRFATAAFAMGPSGIYFIEATPGLEGYVIDANGIATQTSGFGAFLTS
eukprot:gene15522-15669_t